MSGRRGRVATLIWDARFSLVTTLLAGFGRAAAEVGTVMIVGGNIDGFTRTMTTAIALETSKGDLPLAMGLGLVLIAIVIAINALAWARGASASACGMTCVRRRCDLPITFDNVTRRGRRGDDPRPDHARPEPRRTHGPDRSERLRQDHAAAHRHGSRRAIAGRITWGGRAGSPRECGAPSCSSAR